MRDIGMFVIMVVINIIIFVAQLSVTNLAAETGVPAPNFGETPAYVKEFNKGINGNYTINEDYTGKLPTSNAGVMASIGAYLFPFQVLLNWLTGAPSMIMAFIMTVPNLLVAMKLPAAIAYILGFGWVSLAIMFLIMAVLK